eukprot:jgi/Orpsp1_1/1188294/evm.model.d7180000063677.1
MDLNKHPPNYIILRKQVSKLKKKTFPPAIKKVIRRKKKERILAKSQPFIIADSFKNVNKLYNALTISKYQKIPNEFFKGVTDIKKSIDNNQKLDSQEKVIGNREDRENNDTLQQDIQNLIKECNNNIEKGDIQAIVKDLLRISKIPNNNNKMDLKYDQLSDFALLQVYQNIFIDTTNVPYNAGLNIINYTLYRKLKNLNDIPNIQLLSINEIVGNYNKKLLINGILLPLLAEPNFEKFQAQLVTKIFKEIKFTSEEYSLLLKNFVREKYENTGNSGKLEDILNLQLNENHLNIIQTIINQKISFNNDLLRDILSVYNLFSVSDIKSSNKHGMFLFSLCKAFLKVKITQENYQELYRLSNIHETFLKKRISDTLSKFKK